MNLPNKGNGFDLKQPLSKSSSPKCTSYIPEEIISHDIPFFFYLTTLKKKNFFFQFSK